ncbi:MAG: ABC transporter permease [Eubacteriales bacterium]|nr:ABC transporter permease [Eubacteriales bacterium]MDD3073310.1 ABC transporter permease [Eubacteriales bacterium]MDD4078531.1 ABC transporter permease [Eubacteriales bacterium]MDD4768672.1 ABC transporter permease [Eubacteriales bacterium]
MNMKIMTSLSAFEFRLFSRNLINMFFLLVFPTLMILLFGGIFGNEPQELYGWRGTVDVSVPAYAGMIISVTGLMSLPLTLSEYREKRILKRYKATPMEPIYVILSQVLISTIMTVVGMLLLIIVAKLVFGLRFEGNVVAVIAVFLYSTLSLYSLGFLLASLAPNMKAATALANLVYFPMLFLTGATIPIEVMPDIMRKIAQFLPVTHIVSAMKTVWFGDSILSAWPNLLVITGCLVVCLALSLKFFRWE